MQSSMTGTGTIEVPDAPMIPGLFFRHFRGEEDYPAMVEVNSASKIADGLGHDLHTVETMPHTYAPTANYDPYRDVLIAEIDGRMVAYNRVYLERELDGSSIFWHFGFVVPRWRGKGLGKAMIHWAERRARQMDAEREGKTTTFASTTVPGTMERLRHLLEGIGYQPVRFEFDMETPDLDHIPDVPLPEGFEIRPATPEHYRKIWDASSEAFRDHWGATESTGEDFERFMAHPLTRPDLWVVAWDGDRVAGSILNFINADDNERSGRKLGYTEIISVGRPWRRRGLARALLARSMQLHKDLGMTQTALGVDTENPTGALHLYQSMGYQVVRESAIYRKRL